jgi:hypothetical protein
MEEDSIYLQEIRDALAVCLKYRPKLGTGKKQGYALDEFQRLYRADPFYAWFGLDSPYVYAAHRAAGGVTSVYRQIGTGAERVFRRVLHDTLGQTEGECKWSYTVPSTAGKTRELSLDGRISLSTIRNKGRKVAVRKWLEAAKKRVGLPKDAAAHILGVVFECRQGYKSKDAKRQNADITNAANAYARNYLPCNMLFSLQIDRDIAERYVRAQWLLLTGTLEGTAHDSTYVFCRNVLGYDLAAFFERNSKAIKNEVEKVIKGLLQK